MYTITKNISNGSFGTIKECIKDGKLYAVKIINVDKSIGLDNLLELSIMNNIKHHNINKAKDILVKNNLVYIFQKKAKCTLYDVYKKDNSKLQIKKWLYDLTSSIKALHDLNIIHCDIKLNNVLLSKSNRIKLTDFGESTKIWNKKFRFKHETSTPRYKPPYISGGINDKSCFVILGGLKSSFIILYS